MEPVDYLAFLGPNPVGSSNIHVITGDSGNGLTHATIGARLIADRILGRTNPYAELYDPSRKTLRAASDYTHENLNVVAQYRAWLTPGEVKNVDDIAPGSGAIMRHGVRKVAVYRDEAGAVHTYSAKCPHLGCLVEWNRTERTWDCPCHGSRFDTHGRVINGPANVNLTPEETDVKRTG
jgi:Rieske Fe-S protein